MKRIKNKFIDNKPIEEANKKYIESLSINQSTEIISVKKALHRKTATPNYAKKPAPHYHSAAMDGIALKANITYGANEKNPVKLKPKIDFVYVNTGNPLPKNCDSVIMIEDVQELEDGSLEIYSAAYPWQHVRTVGEDFTQGELILPENHYVRPLDLSALLNAGIETISVFVKPKLGIIPTGNEITSAITGLKKGEIIDTNTYLFEGLAIESGVIAKPYPIVKDSEELLREAVKKAVSENDIVIINAGSSAGSKDFTVDVIRELGEVIIHGVAVKPGKPTILGKINNKPVIGIPGYPVSAFFAFHIFVEPILGKMTGKTKEKNYVQAKLASPVPSSLKHDEWLRVSLAKVGKQLIASPLHRGSGNTMSLVKADGIMLIPRQVEGYEAGAEIAVEIFKPERMFTKRLMAIGSHDVLLDDVSTALPLASTHVGSFGGILAMRKAQCHIAPIHFLNNAEVVSKYFPNKKMALISVVKRKQGLIIAKGNPLNIVGIEDLCKKDIQFINRQNGSGTRILLDDELKKRSLDVAEIDGYKHEVNTHMMIAVAVKSGVADAGLGVYSAANAMGLDFVPVASENYDFLCEESFLATEQCKQLISFLKGEEFRLFAEKRGGYDTSKAGNIKIIGANCD